MKRPSSFRKHLSARHPNLQRRRDETLRAAHRRVHREVDSDVDHALRYLGTRQSLGRLGHEARRSHE